MMKITAKDGQEINNLFTYHAPTKEQIVRYQNIREAAKSLAIAIMENAPQCADRTAAIRKLRECVMTANASIALEDGDCA